MKLSQMFENAPEIEITGLYVDPRCAKVNDIRFCMEGMVHDGHGSIGDAIEEGIKCTAHSKPVGGMKKGVVYIRTENVNRTLNQAASMFYGHPSRKMKIFGVAGTNRKSAITSITRDIYSYFAPCSYIGAISISYGEMTLPSSLTTPDAVLTHKTMKDMVEHGIQAVALEVSSHGLELGRVQSMDFDVAVFSNLTYGHLDFHDTVEHYFEAKKKLFTDSKGEGVVILNADDTYVDQLADATEASVVTCGINGHTTYQAKNIRVEKMGLRLALVHGIERYEVSANLIVLYNIYNLLGAVAVMAESGVPIERQLPYLRGIRQIEGRMERIDEGQPFNVIVDLVHTPGGMERVFEYVKDITEDGHSITAVFGSVNKRGTKKRRVFDEIASCYCDSIVLAEDDPRDEDSWGIVNKVRSGISDTNSTFVADHYAATRQAIEGANVEDIILILGKGDEVFMYRESGREP